MTTQSWELLKAALSEEASELAFRVVCGILATWPEADAAAAFEFADRASCDL